ncbi:unnamed protein product [Rangifer tarandus platyrhynchus]|uniref:Uncharacterized protein n=1 Tax=Rangifer tarandus platyrhynchus TaxID=3082113 RepID=A0AC59ZK29_RANTA
MLHARKSAKRRRVTQSPPVSIANFVKVSFRVRFIFSTCHELWGVYSQCNFHFVPRAWASPCTIWLTKAGPLSEPIVTGSPYLGTISSKIFLATTTAVSPFAGKASTHPEKVSTRTNRQRYPYLPGFTSVKSISQCCPGSSPRYLVPVCCFFPALISWHALQA